MMLTLAKNGEMGNFNELNGHQHHIEEQQKQKVEKVLEYDNSNDDDDNGVIVEEEEEEEEQGTKQKNKRRAWTEEEDRMCMSMIMKQLQQHKDAIHDNGNINMINLCLLINWNEVSIGMHRRRSAKQCRERWRVKLDPSVSTDPWSVEEDNKLLSLQSKIGNSWKAISNFIPGRSEHACKSRYRSLSRHLLHKSHDSNSSNPAKAMRCKVDSVVSLVEEKIELQHSATFTNSTTSKRSNENLSVSSSNSSRDSFQQAIPGRDFTKSKIDNNFETEKPKYFKENIFERASREIESSYGANSNIYHVQNIQQTPPTLVSAYSIFPHSYPKTISQMQPLISYSMQPMIQENIRSISSSASFSAPYPTPLLTYPVTFARVPKLLSEESPQFSTFSTPQVGSTMLQPYTLINGNMYHDTVVSCSPLMDADATKSSKKRHMIDMKYDVSVIDQSNLNQSLRNQISKVMLSDQLEGSDINKVDWEFLARKKQKNQ